MKQYFKINNNGTALLMTILILTSVLTVSLGAASLIMSGIAISRTQTYSTLSYFAAEAGAERSLWEARKSGNPLPDADKNGIFSAILSNNSSYLVDYATSTPNVDFYSTGSYSGTRRMVQISYEL